MSLNIVILAAGQGTRMKSSHPKVLHCLAGKPILQHVLETAENLSPQNIYIIYGHQGEKIREYFNHYLPNLIWVEQKEQLGTAHAVMQVLPYLNNPDEKVLILSGDVPLISKTTLEAGLLPSHFTRRRNDAGIVLWTTVLDNPTGFGRIIRNRDNKIIKITEEKDASQTEKEIKEINAGIYLTTVKNLKTSLSQISQNNIQKEFYLTDIVSEEIDVTDIIVQNPYEVYGVNDLEQLYLLECYYQQNMAKKLRLSGVRVDQNVIFEGNIEIGTDSKIGANCILKNIKIGRNTEIKPNSIIENSIIGDDCRVGPFARIRPGTKLSSQVHIGNFVEIKNSDIHHKSKIPHLSYVGDTTMGESVNFGAGAITCNYDGANKHRTIIGNNVFIGSDAQLIAPIKIEDGSTIGAGSTISKNTPANKLTISRAKQQTIEHWVRPKKEEK